MMAMTSHDSARNMLGDLQQELLSWLALPTAFIVSYALLFADHFFGVERLSVPGLVAWVVVASLAAQGLKARRPRPAALAYLAGVAPATLALVWITFSPLTMALLPAVLLLSMALVGRRAALAVAILDAAVLVGAAWQHNRLNKDLLAPVTVVLVTTLVAWLLHRNLTTAIQWAWSSYQQARESTEEARAHRAELAKTLKALDEAYYRLERFSAQLAQAREAAEEARRAKQQFVATVSHELRTPLNIIIGFAELMTLSPESYGVRGVPRPFMGDVNRIYRSAQHLKGLIDDVLDLSQIDAGHMLLLSEPVDLRQVVGEATDMIWSLAAKKGLQVRVDVPASLPPITLDRLRIRQVLLNLLSNAVRYTEQGSISLSARLVALPDGADAGGMAGSQSYPGSVPADGYVHLEVADTGRGIAPADLDRVFEEFRQLDQSLSRQHEGTGLGLALSRRFVELHGGRMWAESELGKGSRFHLTLPLAPMAPAQALHTTPLPLPATIAARGGRSVVALSQEPMVLNLLRRHLHGYQVQSAAATDLRQVVASELPQAVIVNSLGPAPESDGALPIPVITCPLPDSAALGALLGADHYLVKPITRERLLDLLEGYGEAVRRVLIVDDDAQLAELLARIARAAPRAYEVDVACGGEEGLSRMREAPADLVLLDLVMPGLDGMKVLQAIRTEERLRAARVAILTAHDLPVPESRLPGYSEIRVQGPGGFSVAEVLNCVQALLDALPAPRPASSLPARPPATRPVQPAS